jgi:hypothetical protein
MSDDPYVILGLDEAADDEAVKRRYLALVRAYPPDREPERFKLYRAAYEALIDEHSRLERRILHTNGAALARLKAACLSGADPSWARLSKTTVTALLTEGLEKI